jgi:hypothetical protein
VVLAVAEKDNIISDIHRRDIIWDKEGPPFDPTKPVTWHREHKFDTTMEAYNFLDGMEKYQATACGLRINLTGRTWLEFAAPEEFRLKAPEMRQTVEYLRHLLPEGQVSLTVRRLWFSLGQHLLDWVAEAKTELKPGEVEQ